MKEDGEGCKGIGLGVCHSPEAEHIAVVGLCWSVLCSGLTVLSTLTSLPLYIHSQYMSYDQLTVLLCISKNFFWLFSDEHLSENDIPQILINHVSFLIMPFSRLTFLRYLWDTQRDLSQCQLGCSGFSGPLARVKKLWWAILSAVFIVSCCLYASSTPATEDLWKCL